MNYKIELFNHFVNYLLDSHLEYAGFDYKKSVNTTAQHTNLYQNKDLVVRRSASFNFDLKFKTRSFDATKDSVAIEFAIGKNKFKIGRS